LLVTEAQGVIDIGKTERQAYLKAICSRHAKSNRCDKSKILLKPLPSSIQEMAAALVGCVAGVALVEETRAMLEKAGFTFIVLMPKPDYVRNMHRIGTILCTGKSPRHCRKARRSPTTWSACLLKCGKSDI
jgi:hypothetical protein